MTALPDGPGAPTVHGPVVSGRFLAISLVAIVGLAAAPFLVAAGFNVSRNSAAREQVRKIADALRELPVDTQSRVLVGSGKLPEGEPQSTWLGGPSEPMERRLAHPGVKLQTTDPWRNAYLANVGARGAVWVISAGTNGIVETPFDDVSAPVGDDIGARVR